MYRTAMMTATLAMTATGPQVSVTRSGPNRRRKTSKERMRLDRETDDVEAQVKRLETLGATRWDHQQERGFDFFLRDPWSNEFCVLHPEFPELLARQEP